MAVWHPPTPSPQDCVLLIFILSYCICYYLSGSETWRTIVWRRDKCSLLFQAYHEVLLTGRKRKKRRWSSRSGWRCESSSSRVAAKCANQYTMPHPIFLATKYLCNTFYFDTYFTRILFGRQKFSEKKFSSQFLLP